MKKPVARSTSGRAGRRGGASTSRSEILAAARARFAQQGYATTTIRQVAADAGVDPALVHYFFKSKDGLFGAVMDLPGSPAVVIVPALAPGVDGAGARLVRAILEYWDEPAAQAGLLAILRSAAARPEAADLVREFVTRELQPRISHVIDRPDSKMRAVLIGATLMGLAVERYVVAVEPLASADREDIVAWVGPVVQRYLSDDPPPGARVPGS
jgi:AcrR family transcriptional regulator